MYWLENNNGLILSGKLGVNPFVLAKYFKSLKVKKGPIEIKLAVDNIKLMITKNQRLPQADAYIFVYLYNKEHFGGHYVTFKSVGNGKYHFYNDQYGVSEDIRTLKGFMSQEGYIGGAIYTVNRKH